MTKTVELRKQKICAICGRDITVTIYTNKSYRGGHFFGKVRLHTNMALREAAKAGYREANMGGIIAQMMKKEPVTYKHLEYWECPKCYWNK